MRKTLISMAAMAAFFAPTAMAAPENSASDDVAVTFNLSVEEAVTLAFDGDIAITQASQDRGQNSGFVLGCMGLNIGPTIDVSISGATRPAGSSYFYLAGPDGTYLRYHTMLSLYLHGETMFTVDDPNGSTRQYTVPDAITEETSDVCGEELTVQLLGIIQKHSEVYSDDNPTAENVFQFEDEALIALPTGDHAFSDTLTITVSPALTTG